MTAPAPGAARAPGAAPGAAPAPWRPPTPPEPVVLDGADGGPLRADLYRGAAAARDPHPTLVVLCHGFRSYKNWGFVPFLASRLTEDGHAVIAFNFTGSGVAGDDGAFTEPERFRLNTYTRELTDLSIVLMWAEQRLRPRATGLAGHSRGGAIALIHAAENPDVRAVVTLATPRAIGVWPEDYFHAWERGEDAEFLDYRSGTMLRLGPQYLDTIRAMGDRCDLTRAVGALRVPLLVVQGERDTLVRMDEARALASAGASNLTELMVIEEAGHGFQAGDVLRRTPPPLLDMTEATAGWMRRWLPDAGPREP
jgi:pimeloyl-ACP methyl ester carboxylesterase